MDTSAVPGRGMTYVRRRLPKQPAPRPGIADWLMLRLCTSRSMDGLWLGTMASPAEPILHRVEEALAVIKRCDPLQHARIINNLERIWVDLLPDARACFQSSLRACVLDERFVLAAATTPAMIARTIVHEATHARLDRCGIGYDEEERTRVEGVCIRRELAFAAKLPDAEPMRVEIARTLEWCAGNPDYYSDVNFNWRDTQGRVAALRYLGTPDWVIRIVLKAKRLVAITRRWVGRLARPRPRQA